MTRKELKILATDPTLLRSLGMDHPVFTQETERDIEKLRVAYEALGVVINVLTYVKELNSGLFPQELGHEITLRAFDGSRSVGIMDDRTKEIATQAQEMLGRVGIKIRIYSNHWRTIRVEFPTE